MKRMLLTYALALFAVVGISAQEWCRTLATGLPGQEITHDVNGFSVTQYRAETALIQNAGATGVRYTVVNTNNTNMAYGGGPFFAMGEMIVLDAAGDTINYTVTSNADHNSGGAGTDGAGLPALNDGNLNNFFHSSWGGTEPGGLHYLELTFESPVDAFQLVWYTRPNQHVNRPQVVGLTNPGVDFTEDMLFAEYEFEAGEQVTDASEFANGGTFTLFVQGPTEFDGTEGNGNTYIALSGYTTGSYEEPTVTNLVQFIPSSNGKFVLYQPIQGTYYAAPDRWTDGYNGQNGWLRAYSEGWTLAEFEITQRPDGDFEITTELTRQYVDRAWVNYDEPLKVWVGYDMRGNLKIFPQDVKDGLEQGDYTLGFGLPVDFGFTIYHASASKEMVPDKTATEMCSEVLADILNVATEKEVEYADYLDYDWNGAADALAAALESANAAVAAGDLAASFAAKADLENALAGYVAILANYYEELLSELYIEVEENMAEPPYTQDMTGMYTPATQAILDQIIAKVNQVISDQMGEKILSYSQIEALYAEIESLLEQIEGTKLAFSSFPETVADIPADNFPYAYLPNNAVWRKNITLAEATEGIRLTFLESYVGSIYDSGNFPMISLGEIKLYDANGKEVTLTESNFYANYTEAVEGFECTVARLCDGNFGAQGYYQSPWSGNEPQEYIYIDIVFPEAMDNFTFEVYSRDKYTSGGKVSLFPKKVTITSADKTPIIKTPVASVKAGVYTTVQSVTFESEYAKVENPSISYHYTIDGNEPTKESTLLEGALEVTESCTVKVVAVMTVDGEEYTSEVASYEYIISEAINFVAATATEQIVAGKILIVADGKAADAKAANYGYLPVRDVTATGGTINEVAYYAFELEAAEGGWYIKDNAGKYLYMTGTYNSFNMIDTVPAEGGVWTIAIAEDGTATITNVAMSKYIQYSTGYNTYGAYAEAQDGGVVPTLYVPYVEPTPEPEETFPRLSTDAKRYYYRIASYNRGGYLTSVGDGNGVEHVAESKASYWYFTKANENGGIYFHNYTTEQTLGADKTMSDTPGVWYVLPNGVNEEGLSISSTNPISDMSCIDANNYNTGVGAWHPTATDWHGTTWVFTEVDFDVIAAELKAAREAFDVAYADATAILDEAAFSVTENEVALQTTDPTAPYYLMSNYPETYEGSIDALVDNTTDNGEFFHTLWTNYVPNVIHYLEVDLGEGNEIAEFTFGYHTRIFSGNEDFPDGIQIMGSNDGKNFKEVYNVTSGLPQASDKSWKSSIVSSDSAYRYLRFNITAERIYWHMSEFDLNTCEIAVAEKYADLAAAVLSLQVVANQHANNADYSIEELNTATRALTEAIKAVVEPEPEEPIVEPLTVVAVTPSEAVSELSTITVEFSEEIAGEQDLMAMETIYVGSRTNACNFTVDGKVLTITLWTPITAPGEYALKVPASVGITRASNGEAVVIDGEITFTVEAPAAPFEVVAVTPSEAVTELSTITVEFSEEIAGEQDLMAMETIYVGSRTNACNFTVDGKVLTITLWTPITAPGEYALKVPASVGITRASNGEAVTMNGEYVFTVKEAVVEPERFTVTAALFPTVEGDVTEIKGIRVEAGQGPALANLPTGWTLTNEAGDEFTMNIEWLYDYETILIMVNPAITEAGTYTLTIPAGSLKTDDGKECEAAEFSWTIKDPYMPRYTGTKTRADRAIKGFTLTGASGENTYTLTADEQTQDYTNATSTVFKVEAGEELTISFNKAGSWIHQFVFIDFDGDGFTASIAEGSEWAPAEDLVAYSFYNNNSDSDASGWNSKGTVITGNDRNTPAVPAFNAPEAAGIYRMRVKQDWCNIDPAGDADGKFGDFKANGGQIIDVILEVVEETVIPVEPLEVVAVTPAEAVTELSTITVEFSDEIAGTQDIMAMEQIYVGSRGNMANFTVEGKVLTITLWTPITTPGEYGLYIPAGVGITRASNSTGTGTGTGNGEAVTMNGEIKFIVEGNTNMYKPGDANGDGKISISDVVFTVNAVLGRTQSSFVFDAADMNGDRKITISDVVNVVNVLLNDDSGEESEIPSGSIGIGDDVDNAVTNAPMNRGLSALHVDNVAVENNEATMAVKLDNAGRYTAMQFDMALPEGVSIKEVTMNGKHTVSHNGSRVVAYSLTNRAFDNDEDIMTITLNVENAVENATVTFDNIIVGTPEFAEKRLNAVSARIEGTTGIADNRYEATGIYTENGRIVIEATSDGVAEVVTADGIVRKVEITAGKNHIAVGQKGMFVVKVGNKIAKVVL